jgi:predicted dehydrogenase
LGVVGLGVISRFYLAAIARFDQLTLAAACDLDEDKLRRFEREGVATTRALDELLALEAVEAVVVNVPNSSHREICAAALRAGKHVCCEKPLVLDAEQAEELAELARSAGKVLFTAFHRRYNRHVRRLREEIQRARADGISVSRCRVEYLERIEEHCGNDRWYLDPSVTGGGCIADNGPNAYDTAEFLLGPLEAEGATVDRDSAGLDLRAVIDLRAETGTEVRLDLDWAYDGERKLVTAELSDGRTLSADMLDGYPGFKTSLFHEYEGALSDFTAAVAGREGCGGDGLRNVRFVERAYELATPPAVAK